MSNKDNGGPVFPFPILDGQTYKSHQECDGMTLRDYFAAKASDGDVTAVMMDHFDCFTDRYSITRQQARYIHADAMLHERAK